MELGAASRHRPTRASITVISFFALVVAICRLVIMTRSASVARGSSLAASSEAQKQNQGRQSAANTQTARLLVSSSLDDLGSMRVF